MRFLIPISWTSFTCGFGDSRKVYPPQSMPASRSRWGQNWNHTAGDGELIDDASRFDGNKARSKKNYEDGMARAFQACHPALRPDGRLVVVFANKNPDAWETLVSALIRAGFVVDGSWPIQTEMGNRTRAIASAALASSVWLVCKKRSAARPGWDNAVLAEMRERIHTQLRAFWDAGIRGPDFVWAATGPALEAFSQVSRREKGRRAERADDCFGVPARGSTSRGRLRRGPSADPWRGDGDGRLTRRRHYVLPAAS